jgi:hypothetical protein
MHRNDTEMAFASDGDLRALLQGAPSSPEDVAARREAARERRIAAGRAAAAPSAEAVATTGLDQGNGAPPTLSPSAELAAIGELLYGPRWTTDVARILGHGDGRTVRRIKSGEAVPSDRDLAVLRRQARDVAKAILRLVGDGIDDRPAPRRDPSAIRAAFEAEIARARGAAQA